MTDDDEWKIFSFTYPSQPRSITTETHTPSQSRFWRLEIHHDQETPHCAYRRKNLMSYMKHKIWSQCQNVQSWIMQVLPMERPKTIQSYLPDIIGERWSNTTKWSWLIKWLGSVNTTNDNSKKKKKPTNITPNFHKTSLEQLKTLYLDLMNESTIGAFPGERYHINVNPTI